MNREILTLQRELLLEQLMEVENQLNENGIKKSKGFTLIADEKGIWFVRYIDPITKKQQGKRCLYTTDRTKAESLAEKYRDVYVKKYNDKKNGIENLSKFFSEYYELEKSAYLQEVLKTGGRKLREKQLELYGGFVNNYFIPFLNENKIKRLNEINIKRLKEFQIYLLDKKDENGKPILKPQTINDRIGMAIRPIFSNLVNKGVIKETPFIENVKFNLPESETKKRRGILNTDKTLSVLLDKEIWKLYETKEDITKDRIANQKHHKKYRLLCLLMATTGLRNAEIFMLRKENIIKIRRTYFIDVVNSRIEDEGLKTESSKRKVPIPSITLEALNEYISENNITDYLFYTGSKRIHYNTFLFAKNQFGSHCGYDEKMLKEKNFDFYSFRHFYKTMLTRSNVKDAIVEYFMGHSVNVSDMNKNYTHIEDLDDIFFEEYGLKVIEHIDNQFQNAMNKLDLLSIHTHIEQVSLTDNKNNTKTYYTNVLNDLDFEDETRFYLDDLQDKGVLSNTNSKQQLLSDLKTLLENEAIDKRRYDDCVDYIKNDENQYFT